MCLGHAIITDAYYSEMCHYLPLYTGQFQSNHFSIYTSEMNYRKGDERKYLVKNNY